MTSDPLKKKNKKIKHHQLDKEKSLQDGERQIL